MHWEERDEIINSEPWKIREFKDDDGNIRASEKWLNIPSIPQEYIPPVDPNKELRDIVAAQSAQIELLLAALNK